jgi:hypothetical protein
MIVLSIRRPNAPVTMQKQVRNPHTKWMAVPFILVQVFLLKAKNSPGLGGFNRRINVDVTDHG